MSAFDETEFHASLEKLVSFEDRISFVEAHVNVLRKLVMAERMIAKLCGYDMSCADLERIAKVVRKGLGLYGIDGRETLSKNSIRTIVDAIIERHNRDLSIITYRSYDGYHHCFGRLIKALRKVGFQTGDEIRKLLTEASGLFSAKYSAFEMYRELRALVNGGGNLPALKYPYKEIRNHYGGIHEALAMHFYHPDRLHKWMKANPDKDLETYML